MPGFDRSGLSRVYRHRGRRIRLPQPRRLLRSVFVQLLVLPELADYRIILAEAFAFAIMVALVLLGPKRAVPLFLLGGGTFTLFTIGALLLVVGYFAPAPPRQQADELAGEEAQGGES